MRPLKWTEHTTQQLRTKKEPFAFLFFPLSPSEKNWFSLSLCLLSFFFLSFLTDRSSSSHSLSLSVLVRWVCHGCAAENGSASQWQHQQHFKPAIGTPWLSGYEARRRFPQNRRCQVTGAFGLRLFHRRTRPLLRHLRHRFRCVLLCYKKNKSQIFF